MGMHVLVTGGAGFVGSHTVDALLRRGHAVRVYDNVMEQVHPAGIPDYVPRDVEFIRGDMRDVEKLREAVCGSDVIFHLARKSQANTGPATSGTALATSRQPAVSWGKSPACGLPKASASWWSGCVHKPLKTALRRPCSSFMPMGLPPEPGAVHE
jgi:hypothetical protein